MFNWENEHPLNQLAHDRQQELIAENYWNEFRENLGGFDHEYGDQNAPYKISELVKKCMENETGCFHYKESVFWDMSWEEALEDAYVRLGLDSDEFPAPDLRDLGHQLEIGW